MQLQDRAHMVGLHVACRKPRWSKPRRPTQNRAFSIEVCQFDFMVVNLGKLNTQKHLKYWRSENPEPQSSIEEQVDKERRLRVRDGILLDAPGFLGLS